MKSSNRLVFIRGLCFIAILWLIATPFMEARADCYIVWNGTCSHDIVINGQDTQRTTGSVTIHDYHQDWGSAAKVIPEGYWNPAEGEKGVRWDCSQFYIHGQGIGWKVIYLGGGWHQVMEQVLVVDQNGVFPGDPGYIPTYESQPVRYGLSIAACQYFEPGQDIKRVRWRDTRDEWKTIPFQDVTIIPWVKIVVVTNYYRIEVPLPYPYAQVVRNPWPRAITGQPEHFTATAGTFEAASDPIASCTPDIKNFQLHIRLTPMLDVSPLWNFDERAWSREPATESGWEVSHIFDTASYNLPAIGPSLDGATKLPSYKVNLSLAWLVEADRTWIDFHGIPRETGWQVVDLTRYGYNTPYLVTTGARDVTPPPAGVPKQVLPPFVVPVPVIESQGILSAP